MKLQCIRHKTELENGRCVDCYAENTAAWEKWVFEKFGPNAQVTYSMNPHLTDSVVLCDGIARPMYHESEWLEYSGVPKDTYHKITEFIKDAVSDYGRTCPCVQCEKARRENHKGE